MKTRFLMANTFASVVAAVLVAQAGGPAVVFAAEHAECSHLVTLKLPDVKVTEAVAVPAAETGPIRAAHCRVNGVIEKDIRFSLLLPDDWNHKFLMGGGGGFVAGIDNQARGSVNAGYATVGTDTGHQGAVAGAGWALNDLERQLNFARGLQIDTRVLQGADVPESVVAYARLHNVTQILVMREPPNTIRSWFASALVQRLVNLARDMQVTVVADRVRQASKGLS